LLAGAFGSSIYPAGWSLHAFDAARAANASPLAARVAITAVDYSPLIWLGVVGAFVSGGLPIATRTILAVLFALQCAVIYFLLPWDARFLGGLPYGLIIVFAAFASSRLRRWFAPAGVTITAIAILLLPWLIVQLYYATQFFPVSLGVEKAAFYARETAFYADFVKLDRMLAPDTVLLVQGFRLDSVYAPRPVFFDEADLPPEKPAVLFAPPRGSPARLQHHTLGERIYANDQAIVTTYRTPGRRPAIGRLQVTKLTKSP
jgi:hypothetical protein